MIVCVIRGHGFDDQFPRKMVVLKNQQNDVEDDDDAERSP